jgi:tetratricopeptide (TPR) repeat protein
VWLVTGSLEDARIATASALSLDTSDDTTAFRGFAKEYRTLEFIGKVLADPNFEDDPQKLDNALLYYRFGMASVLHALKENPNDEKMRETFRAYSKEVLDKVRNDRDRHFLQCVLLGWYLHTVVDVFPHQGKSAIIGHGDQGKTPDLAIYNPDAYVKAGVLVMNETKKFLGKVAPNEKIQASPADRLGLKTYEQKLAFWKGAVRALTQGERDRVLDDYLFPLEIMTQGTTDKEFREGMRAEELFIRQAQLDAGDTGPLLELPKAKGPNDFFDLFEFKLTADRSALKVYDKAIYDKAIKEGREPDAQVAVPNPVYWTLKSNYGDLIRQAFRKDVRALRQPSYYWAIAQEIGQTLAAADMGALAVPKAGVQAENPPTAKADSDSGKLQMQDSSKKSSDVGGVRFYYDANLLQRALTAGGPEKTSRLLAALARRLGEVGDGGRKQQVLQEFVGELKTHLKADANLETIDHLTAVSLKAIVGAAEKYQDRWEQLPAALRRPGRLTRIHGFVRLPDRQDVLLLGAADPKAPPLELDDLIGAARFVWKEGSVPACSLDPDPDDMAAGRAGPHKVRLHGVPRNTGFANTMLDADYEMKRIVSGTVPMDVPGYLSLKELIRRSRDPTAEAGGCRFWFYPVSPGAGEILAAPDGNIYLFASALQVLTEEVMFTREGMVGTGLVKRTREQAAESFSRHFAALGERRPIFRKLQTLTDLVLLARLWKEMGLRSELLDRLCALPRRSVVTPDSYAGIKEGVISTPPLSFWLVGGVEMRMAAGPRSWLVMEDAEMTAVRRTVRALDFSDRPAQALAGLTLKVVVPSQAVRRQPTARALRAGLQRGDLKAALQAAGELVAADPWDAEALVLRALVRLRSADYGRSRLDAAKARALDPHDPAIAAAVADILFQCRWMEGDPDGALRAVEASLQQDPDRARAHVARAEVLTLLGKTDEARQALLKAVRVNPASALPCARLAVLELSAGRTLAAQPWVRKALALDPKMPEVRIASAHWQMAAIRPDLAEKIARQVWEEGASDPTVGLEALAVLAAVSASREKWNDVERYIGLMERLHAGSPEVLVVAAEISATWGERQRAVRYLERAERLSPGHPLVLKLRAKLGK